jgi:hypothetical protein
VTASIPVCKGGECVAWALVDDADFEMVSNWRWSLNSRGYAMGSPGLLHRVLLGLTKGDKREVDHWDRDKMNNRRSNLRIATRLENVQNTEVSERVLRDRQRCRQLWDAGLTRTEIAAEIGRRYGFVCTTLRGERRSGAHPSMVWTPDRIAEFFHAFHAEHGRLPTQQEMDGQDGRPWFTVIYRRFVGIAEAREYAGFGTVDLRRAA